MKHFKLYLVFFLLFTSQTFLFAKSKPFVNTLEIKKFSGLWYEIARTYNDFEDGCIAPSIEYIQKGEDITVYNRCFEDESNENIKEYKGSVDVTYNPVTITKTYFWIFSQSYHLLYLDEYKSAVMSDKEYKNIWIMSRTPSMKEDTLKEILTILSKHMDTTKLIFPKQYKDGRYK